jgi:hypothetical protein
MKIKKCIDCDYQESIRTQAISEFKEKLKERLFNDPEPCCHGVREREASKIIEEISQEILK